MKPMLFNTDMVCAIRDGKKTVTRRLVKPQPVLVGHFWELGGAGWCDTIKRVYPVPGHSLWNRQPCKPGEILYIRETWAMISDWTAVDPDVGMPDGYIYKADWSDVESPRWHPSIHMPKDAARIFLRVKDVHLERLQDMTVKDIEKEGVSVDCTAERSGKPDDDPWIEKFIEHCGQTAPYVSFVNLWNKTLKPDYHLKYGWIANPWVWVIEFEKVTKEEAWRGDDDQRRLEAAP